MPKVLNRKSDNITKDDVYVGRPSKWGNPFKIQKDFDRDKVIKAYEDYLMRSGLIAEIEELRDKNLVCWCAPLPCHADVLLKYANRE